MCNIILYSKYVLALWEENALLFIAINCNKFKYSNKQKMVASYIGASLSEHHTRELGGEISVRLLVCIRRTSRAN